MIRYDEATYRAALPQVYGYLLPRCGSVADAEDLNATVAALRASGATFRRGIAAGAAVDTALLADPAGNLVEPRAGYHERTTTKE